MSDARRAGFDTKGAAFMKAIADTMGMTAPQQAAFWLENITAAIHRGPHRDTWSSARDRAAELAGIEPSMARRIWQRWRDMKDVSGDAAIKLMITYEAIREGKEVAANAADGSARLEKFITAYRAAEHGERTL